MEKPGKQLFIFPDESGDRVEKNVSQEDLSPPEKIRKELLFKDLTFLQDKYGVLNNEALLEGGYFRRSSNYVQQEIGWINEFAGKEIVKVSKIDESRMTWVPRQQEGGSSAQQAA